MIEVRVLGADELRRAAAQFRTAESLIDQDLVAGIRRAVAPIGRNIRSGIPAYMPSGYAPVLAPAMRVTTSVRRVRLPGVSIRVRAMGQTEQRDVRSLDAGILAHKTFGHSPWHRQRIRAGFVMDPFDRLSGPVLAEMGDVIEDIVRRLARG